MSSVHDEDVEDAIFDMIQKVLKGHEAEDILLPMALNEAARKKGNVKVLKRFMKSEAQFKNAVLQQVGYAQKEFNVDLEQDPAAMLRDYFDRFAISKVDNPKAFDIIAKRAMSNARNGVAASMPSLAGLHLQEANLLLSQRVGDWCVGACGGTDVFVALEKSTKMARMVPYVRCAGTVLTVGFLGYDFYTNVKSWRNGKIDGVTCSRNISSSLAGVGGGLAGAMGGAVVAGAPGALVGAIVGALVGGQATASAFDLVLGDDRERAALKCYKILGLTASATNEDIRKEYMKLAKIHHPDKNNGKNTEKFVEINLAYELIRAERVADVTAEKTQS